jgi:hypothetical protein
MKPTTREWLEKAEADFAAALLLRRSRKKHSRDIVCFHLQHAWKNISRAASKKPDRLSQKLTMFCACWI